MQNSCETNQSMHSVIKILENLFLNFLLLLDGLILFFMDETCLYSSNLIINSYRCVLLVSLRYYVARIDISLCYSKFILHGDEDFSLQMLKMAQYTNKLLFIVHTI